MEDNLPGRDAEIDITEVLALLWARRLIILIITGCTIFLGTVYLRVATYTYTAELKVTPTQEDKGLSGSIGNLASLAGVNIANTTNVSPFTLYLEGVLSRQVADVLTRRSDVMTVVFGGQWDATESRWVEPESALQPVKDIIKFVLGFPSYNWQEPSAADLEKYIQKNVMVEEDQKTSIASITFDHPNPEFAVKFLSYLHEATDQILRERTLVRSTQYIEYLQKKLESVTVAEHRAALVQALSEQEKLRMMASSNVAFAAEPFGPVKSSARPTSPQPAMVLALSALIGILISIGVIFVRSFAAAKGQQD